MAHNSEHFLAALRHDPTDVATWQIFADFLEEQGDPTCEFIRLSLDLTVGRTPHGSAEASISRFETLLPLALQEARLLLASYRCGLPVRFRVMDTFQMGDDPPPDMFAYERTVAVGYLEAGALTPGMESWRR
jgi:uncharacterized protein (TIGR02996 family)